MEPGFIENRKKYADLKRVNRSNLINTQYIDTHLYKQKHTVKYDKDTIKAKYVKS